MLDKFLSVAPTLIVGGASVYAFYKGDTTNGLIILLFMWFMIMYDKLTEIKNQLNHMENK